MPSGELHCFLLALHASRYFGINPFWVLCSKKVMAHFMMDYAGRAEIFLLKNASQVM